LKRLGADEEGVVDQRALCIVHGHVCIS